MTITRRQLRRIIREEAKSTKKYDDSKHLKGDQDELPDGLQKGIIDKAKKEKKNETLKRRLRKIVERQSLKGRLRQVLQEVMAECPKDLKPGMPCPIKTAEQMNMAGADEDDIMNFVGDLIKNFENPPHAEMKKEPEMGMMGQQMPPQPFVIDTPMSAEPLTLEKDPLHDEIEELIGVKL